MVIAAAKAVITLIIEEDTWDCLILERTKKTMLQKLLLMTAAVRRIILIWKTR